MENLIKKRTECTPEVKFHQNGNLIIRGRSFCEDPKNFYEPLIAYCNNLKAKDVIMDLMVDYLNTASSKCIFEIFEALERNPNIKWAEARWFYEEDDEEMLEMGEIYSDMCKKVNVQLNSMSESALIMA
ncbi:MAG TPA: nuclear pore complex subunit [Bacteroidales bacterium]|jgi:hypothetical protein|nr:nuclear pore complex subunit [Bacteroidales bacterium]